MAFDDFKLGRLFPTREGVAIGTGPERVMLEAVGGADNIKKRFQNNPDGSVTMLQTRNGWPEFTTIPGIPVVAVQCSIEMDSGIVDMIDLTPASPGLPASGLVYQTNYVSSYVAAKTTSIGSGKLIDPNLEGTVVADGAVAKAYADTFLTATAYTDRKIISAKIPSSLFTGRMRLYVQSLYGGNLPALVLSDPSGGAGRPVLGINTSAREYVSLPAVNIGSGSGIFFDAVTMRHYLIQLTTDTAYITPLVGTTCAETYRTTLLAAGLSADDQERIESYILSQSFPDTAATQTVSFTSTPNEALGYSWHFNWDGDKCDIVDVQEVYIAGPNVYGFTTTHYRLTFSQTDGVFSVDRSIVSGPSTWSVPKDQNVIAYPDWTGGNLLKAGNKPSGRTDISQTGRVYCFYAKNSLSVLTVATTPNVAHAKARESSPPVFGGLSYDYPIWGLTETESGQSTATGAWTSFSCMFSIGAGSVGGHSGTKSISKYTATWAGRTAPTFANSGTQGYPAGTVLNFNIGIPDVVVTWDGLGRWGIPYTITYPDTIPLAFPTDNPPPNYTLNITNYSTVGRWDKVFDTYSESTSQNTLAVIPFLDAEAVYLTGKTTDIRTGTHGQGAQYKCTVIGEFDASITGGATLPRQIVYAFSGENNFTTAGSTETYSALNDTATTYADKKLFCSQGVLSVATMPSEEAFYSTADYVSQLYPTYSSANGAVKAPDNGVAAGSATFPTISTFVGWA